MTEFINKEALNRYNDKDFIIFDRSKVRKWDSVLISWDQYYIVYEYIDYNKERDQHTIKRDSGMVMIFSSIAYIDKRNIFKRLRDKITWKYL